MLLDTHTSFRQRRVRRPLVHLIQIHLVSFRHHNLVSLDHPLMLQHPPEQRRILVGICPAVVFGGRIPRQLDLLGTGILQRPFHLQRLRYRDDVVEVAVVDPLRHVGDVTGQHGVAAATDGRESCKARGTMHAQGPSAVAAHAESRHVDAVDVDAVGLDNVIEESGKHATVPAVAIAYVAVNSWLDGRAWPQSNSPMSRLGVTVMKFSATSVHTSGLTGSELMSRGIGRLALRIRMPLGMSICGGNTPAFILS